MADLASSDMNRQFGAFGLERRFPPASQSPCIGDCRAHDRRRYALQTRIARFFRVRNSSDFIISDY
ncbi:hypothetical protein MRS76_03510 [Rhizobiaceae bacterium n13]|uniref:Uncharacterized protein n=1 Tax=Ferirhizobium litorale TaxID=2927786 RepID=A0AAE3TZM9_9HYPH|nr:hypothetical protein [Fererhizobium litorale]MDI7861012.1 hypothetical protein [Fererhizobium litorale]MDI7921159.1 hypothetical protein [Fererhizobium litorale]